MAQYPAEVLYGGTSYGMVNGGLQFNVRVPRELPQGGPVPVQLIAGKYSSPQNIYIWVADPQ
jgi:uncharacterized protein (TIGR03437 family)